MLNKQIPATDIVPSDAFRKLDREALDQISYGGFLAREIQGYALLYLKSPKTNDYVFASLDHAYLIFFTAATTKPNTLVLNALTLVFARELLHSQIT